MYPSLWVCDFVPQVLIVVAPNGVEIVSLCSGSNVCKLHRRDAVNQEFTIENGGVISYPLVLRLHVRLGKHGGSVAASMVGVAELDQ